jgi:hypothetical protein
MSYEHDLHMALCVLKVFALLVIAYSLWSMMPSQGYLVKNGKLNEEDFQWLRKRILDYGNNSIRNIDIQLNSFDFSFKNKEDNI